MVCNFTMQFYSSLHYTSLGNIISNLSTAMTFHSRNKRAPTDPERFSLQFDEINLANKHIWAVIMACDEAHLKQRTSADSGV